MVFYFRLVFKKFQFDNFQKNRQTIGSEIRKRRILKIPYFRYYKTPLYLFLRPFGASFRPRTRFFLASLELLVRLLFKGVFYSRASYISGNTVLEFDDATSWKMVFYCAAWKLALLHNNSRLSEPGVLGSHIWADQLTLSQPRGTYFAHHITTGTPGFSDLPTALITG